MKTSTVVIALLLIAVGILCYGWGRDHAASEVYREKAEASQRIIDALRWRIDSAGMAIEGLTAAMEARTPQKDALKDQLDKEPQRLKDEHTALDTAGAGTLRRIIVWSNAH